MSEIEIARRERQLEGLRAIPTPETPDPLMEVFARTIAEARAMRDALLPNIVNPQPLVEIQTIPAPEVRVAVPDQSAAISALTTMVSALVDGMAALAEAFANKDMSVSVSLPEMPVALTIQESESGSRKTIDVQRDAQGWIKSATVTETPVG